MSQGNDYWDKLDAYRKGLRDTPPEVPEERITPPKEKPPKKKPVPPEEEPLIVYPEEPPFVLEDFVREIFEEPILEGWPISKVLTDRKLLHGVGEHVAWIAEEWVGQDPVDMEHVKGLQSTIINSALRMLTMPKLPTQKSVEVERLRLKVRQAFRPSKSAIEKLTFDFKKLKELLKMPKKELEDRGLID